MLYALNDIISLEKRNAELEKSELEKKISFFLHEDKSLSLIHVLKRTKSFNPGSFSQDVSHLLFSFFFLRDIFNFIYFYSLSSFLFLIFGD